MKDRILFKAKRVDNGGWVIGNLIYSGDAENGYGATIIPISDNLWKKVDKDTICKCTGLKDCKGNLIWENDILMCNGNSEDLIKVVHGEFGVINVETLSVVDRVIGWHYEVVPTDAISICEPFCLDMPLTKTYIQQGEMEVVGNTFDNQKLLNEEYQGRQNRKKLRIVR